MDRFLGKKVDGRYEITEIIGIGGMANVYKAYDSIEHRTVAVKILRTEYMQNDDMRRRFKNESKAMAVLNHPNILKVYDVSFSERLQSIVMEYIDGITLKEYIEQQRVLKWKEAVHFAQQILKGLQHAHDKGIVHRDIKPQNIMLLSDGSIKIADFGIARFARSETRTLTDKAIGSVHYISPEQASGAPTDARTDLYATGVILYEMLTGKVPFEADTPVSVALKQIQTQAPHPCSLNSNIPEGLGEITMHAMEKDMNRRYQSAAQMLRDIEEFKQNPAVSFEYKYLDTPLPKDKEKYSKAITNVRQEKEQKMKEKRRRQKKKRAPIIPVLAGVTTAFCVVTLAFVAWMVYLNNPFVQVDDVVVPTLVGQKWDNVKLSSEYNKLDIQLEEDPVFNNEYGKGVIFEQTPKSGTKIKVSKTIKVKISKGPELTVLDDFVGQDVSQVIAQLNEKGIDYIEKAQYDDVMLKNLVTKTVPPAGTQVQSGEVVTIYVSLGKKEQLVSVPDLMGIPEADAKLVLDNVGLKLGEVTYNELEEDENLHGLITDQQQAPDSQVPAGTPINVTVAGEGSGLLRLRLPGIELPSTVTDKVIMRAVQDGVEVYSEELIPSEKAQWNVSFEGHDSLISQVEIFYDDALYQVYTLDFGQRGHRLDADYSGDFTGGATEDAT